MLGFAVKGLKYNEVNNLVHDRILSESIDEPSVHFRALALKCMEEAINEIGDEPFSLPLLQALILNTHCLLVQGVRGRAWRYLGLCIRSAYELNLHLIDGGKIQGQVDSVKADRWCIEEEWRRAWWAIWEMDVFASTIRRCPTGIDWSQNLTFLPAEDEKWHRGEPQNSSFLEVNVVDRWKQLAASENQSAKAWFIVINSLMKDAQNISSPSSVAKLSPHLEQSATVASANANAEATKRREAQKKLEATNRLLAILNSLHCSVMALPDHARWNGQALTFGINDNKQHGVSAKKLADSAIYSIYVMTQLTKLMSLKYHVFRTGMTWSSSMEESDHISGLANNSSSALDSEYLAEYFEAADNIVSLIRRCPEDHHRYLNPFLASTSWLAGAVQLVRRSLLPDDSSEKDLVASNFALLSMTYRKTVAFWNMSRTPLSHWQSLEDDLEHIKDDPTPGDNFRYDAPFVFTGGKAVFPSSDKANNFASAIIMPPPSSSHGTQGYMISHGNFNGQMPSLASDSGVGDSLASNGDNEHLFQHPTSVEDANVDENANQQFANVPPLDSSMKYAQIPGLDSQVDFSSNFVDPMLFSNERAMNLDFSNYLDEMLSGSYVP
jgi:hypothetical protein